MDTAPADRTLDAARLDRAVTELAAAKDRWAALSIPDRIVHLDQLRPRINGVAAEWVAAAVSAKGIRPGSPLVGEEWISGPYAVLSWIDAATETLRALAAGTEPLAGYRTWTRPDGQGVVAVYPHGLVERLLLHGFTAEVWLEPGAAADVRPLSGRGRHGGAVALVLGAGNISSIAPLDVLYKLYAEGAVVLCKLNPITSYLGPIFRRAFAPLLDAGYLRFADGGGDVGHYLCHHPGVDSVHITGSALTHDAIVYGPGEEGAARKRCGTPVLTKPISSELGGIGPTIVVPGPWADADMAYQAEHIVTQKLHNSGHNCIASQVLVLPETWPGSAALLTAVRRTMGAADTRPAYYPGSTDRLRAAIVHHRQAAEVGTGCAVLIEGVDPADAQAYAFTEEFFGPVLATTLLPGGNAVDFVRNAVAFCNDTLHGTLGANILIHPATAAELGPVLDEAVAGLRYGTVGVNAWTGVGYLTPRATWGAFPGHRLADVGSGIGVVHNALFLERPQKTVVRGPFAPFPRSVRERQYTLAPRPPWFVTNRTAAITGRRLTRFAADGRLRHLPGIFVSALRG